jgi:hypothetical protein
MSIQGEEPVQHQGRPITFGLPLFFKNIAKIPGRRQNLIFTLFPFTDSPKSLLLTYFHPFFGFRKFFAPIYGPSDTTGQSPLPSVRGNLSKREENEEFVR